MGFIWTLLMFGLGWYLYMNWGSIKAKYLNASSSKGGRAKRIDDE